LGLRLVGALRDFWYYSGHIAEGGRWAERACEGAGDAPPALRAKALNAAGQLAFTRGDHAQGELLHREALALSREAGDSINHAWALVLLGWHLSACPDRYVEGVRLCEEGLALFRTLSDMPGIARALNALGELARLGGDYERARGLYEECLAISRETGDRQREAVVLGCLGYVAQDQGDWGLAEARIVEALGLLRELNFKYGAATFLLAMAGPIGAKGDAERAAQILGAGEALLEAIGVGLQPADKLEVDRYRVAVREQLDDATFEAARAAGRAMSVEKAVAYALGEDAEW